MKTKISIIAFILVFSITIGTFATGSAVVIKNNQGGQVNSLCKINERSRLLILKQFGEYRGASVEGMSYIIESYLMNNSKPIDKPKYVNINNFNLEQFMLYDRFEGRSYDFACFFKCVWTVLSQEFEEYKDVKVYVATLKYRKGGYHSYNYISEGKMWYKMDSFSDIYNLRKDNLYWIHACERVNNPLKECIVGKDYKLVKMH